MVLARVRSGFNDWVKSKGKLGAFLATDLDLVDLVKYVSSDLASKRLVDWVKDAAGEFAVLVDPVVSAGNYFKNRYNQIPLEDYYDPVVVRLEQPSYEAIPVGQYSNAA